MRKFIERPLYALASFIGFLDELSCRGIIWEEEKQMGAYRHSDFTFNAT